MPYRILVTAADVTDEILEDVDRTVEWFSDGPMPTDEFLDRLCGTYGARKDDATGEWEGWDIDNFDTPAVRKIMRRARATKREMV